MICGTETPALRCPSTPRLTECARRLSVTPSALTTWYAFVTRNQSILLSFHKQYLFQIDTRKSSCSRNIRIDVTIDLQASRVLSAKQNRRAESAHTARLLLEAGRRFIRIRKIYSQRNVHANIHMQYYNVSYKIVQKSQKAFILSIKIKLYQIKLPSHWVDASRMLHHCFYASP